MNETSKAPVVLLAGMKKNENKIERYVNSYARRSPIERAQEYDDSNRPRFTPLPTSESWRNLSKPQRNNEIADLNRGYKLFKQLNPKQVLINHNRPESNNSLNEGESNLSSKKFSCSINKRLFPNGSHSAKADNRGKDMNSAVKNILENSFEKKVENE